MASIKLQGKGELLVGNDPLVPVGYDIDVQQHGHRQDGRGTLEADSEVLFKALRTGEATLVLQNRCKISIVLTNHTGTSGSAECVTYGPLPLDQ